MKLGGGLRKVYQKRFFLLRGMQLYWFKKKGDVQHVGSLFVKSCMVTRFADKPKFFDIVTDDKTYSMKTKQKYEADEWIEALAFAGAQVTTSYSSAKDTSRALRRLTMSASRPRVSRKESSEEQISRVKTGRPQSNDKGRKEKEQWFKKHHRNRSVSDTEVTLALRMARQLPPPTRHPREEAADEEESPEVSEDDSCSSSSMSDTCPPRSPVHIQSSFVSDFMETPAVTVMPAGSRLSATISEPIIPSAAFSFDAGYMAKIPQGVAPVFSPQRLPTICACTIGSRAPPGGMQMPVMQHTSAPVLRCMGEETAAQHNQFLAS